MFSFSPFCRFSPSGMTVMQKNSIMSLMPRIHNIWSGHTLAQRLHRCPFPAGCGCQGRCVPQQAPANLFHAITPVPAAHLYCGEKSNFLSQSVWSSAKPLWSIERQMSAPDGRMAVPGAVDGPCQIDSMALCRGSSVPSRRTSRQTQLDPLPSDCLFRSLEAVEGVISSRFTQYVEIRKGYGANG